VFIRKVVYFFSISALILAGYTAALLLAGHKIAFLASLGVTMVVTLALINVLKNRIFGITCRKCGSLMVYDPVDKTMDSICKNCKTDLSSDDDE
jgi:hypothetical protein